VRTVGYDAYFETVDKICARIGKTQRDNLETAAHMIADTVMGGGIIHAFGAGHSHVLAEELFCRAGGLGCVNAILEPALMPHSGFDKSSRLERLPDVARLVFEDEDIRSGDLVIAASHSGINPVVVEFAALTRERGVPLIAVTSLEHSTVTPSRHSSGKKLYELASVAIDTGCPLGDAAMEVDGLQAKVAAMSTIAGAVIVQALVYLSVEQMVLRGFDPPVRVSRNLAGKERGNLHFKARYGSRIRRF
jgi:uncharacterized phosphosugar-binding protein